MYFISTGGNYNITADIFDISVNMINLSHFQFDSNPLWDDVLKRLKDMIEVEVSEALTQEMDKEIRSHQCGRAEALTDFKHSLIEAWENANPDKKVNFDA